MATNLSQSLGTADSACSAIAAIQANVVSQLTLLHQRFEAARRAVNLMRGMANNMALPLIPNLPGLAVLDLSSYNRIRISCPALGLPAVDTNLLSQLPGVHQLEDLRVQYQTAVRSLLDQLERSPLGLIDQLERELNNKIDQVLQAVAPVIGVLRCVCSGIDELSDPANVERARLFYDRLTARPTLIDAELTGKMDTFRETKEQLSRIVSLNPVR